MKKNRKNFFGKVIMLILATVMMVSVAWISDGDELVVCAAGESYYITESQNGLAITENMIAPKPTTEGKESYIFAGYFAEATCETPIVKSTDAVVYKKFVPAEIMNVKAQVTKGTTAGTEKTDMRLVTTVDSLNYKEVGFDVYFNGATTPVNAKTTTVYEKIVASKDGNDFGYSPIAFAMDSDYFTTVNLVNIANKNFDKTFLIKPYWKTLDGTKVYGISRMARVSDSYNGIANIPVRIYGNDITAANTITVTYDLADFTYQGFNTGNVDAGATAVDNGDGTITCTTSQVLTNVNELLVNLRFKINDTASSNEKFIMVGAGACDCLYKRFETGYNGTSDYSWYTEFSGGNTYVITTPADFYGFAAIVNKVNNDTALQSTFYGKKVELGADIVANLGNAVVDGWDTDNPTLWKPIGYHGDYPFKGNFQGNGHTISGIYFKDTNATNVYKGLFGYVHKDGQIHNFNLTNSYFEASVSNSTTQVNLGSVAGQLTGQMSSVYSDAIIVSEDQSVGGLAGRLQPAGATQTIENCWYDGKIYITTETSSIMKVAGIGGYAFNTGTTNIKSCLNTGEITYIYHALSESGDIGDKIIESQHVAIGGIIGYLQHNTAYKVNIDKCMNAGKIVVKMATATDGVTSYTDHGDSGVGGYVGIQCNQGDANKKSNVVLSNNITTTSSHSSALKQADGAKTTWSNCDSVKNDNSYYSSVNAWTSAERLGIYTNADDDATKFWVVKENGLIGLKSFTEDWIDFGWYYNKKTENADTFEIETPEEFYAFSYVSQTDPFSGDTVKLTKDIKLNTGKASYWKDESATPGRVLKPIGRYTSADESTAFAGLFDGNNKTISGAYIQHQYQGGGLFGVASGDVKNFKLTNSYVDYKENGGKYVGSIVGQLSGSLENVYSDAYVDSNFESTGGLVGQLEGSTKKTVKNCWYAGYVSSLSASEDYTGGLVGRVLRGNKTIEDCLFTGTVDNAYEGNKVSAYVGGLVGGIASGNGGYAPICYIKNSLSNGTVKVKTEYAVGSVLGRSTSTKSSGSYKNVTNVHFENVYTATTISGVTPYSGHNTTGLGNASLNVTYTYGEPVQLSSSELKDYNAYVHTQLLFNGSKEDTITSGAWVATENGPELKQFSEDKSVKNYNDYTKVATDWYFNAVKYDSLGSDGSGDSTQQTTTFTVENAADMYGLARLVNETKKTFEGYTVEVSDDTEVIDFNEGWVPSVDEKLVLSNTPNTQWQPIGYSADVQFNGLFDGNMSTIKGIYVNSTSDHVGLFGYVGENGSVTNVKLDNSYFVTTGSNSRAVGSVVGYLRGNATNLNVKENVYLYSTSSKRAADGVPIGLGGIVGAFERAGIESPGRISNVWFEGKINVTARNFVGGILGHAYRGTLNIEDCLNTGTVTSSREGGNSTYAAGLIGGAVSFDTNFKTTLSLTVNMKDCFEAGDIYVSAIQAVASVVGRTMQGKVYVNNVYTFDNITNVDSETLDYTGAPVGFGYYSVTNGGVQSGTPVLVKSTDVEGKSAYVNTDLDFWSSDNISGKWIAIADSHPELKDFSDASPIESFKDVQRKSKNWYYNAYTYNATKANGYSASNTQTNYIILDADDMYGLSDFVNVEGKTFADNTLKLGADIIFNNVSTTGVEEATGWADGTIEKPTKSWTPIGTVDGNTTKKAFRGTFDGNGHAIRGLYVTDEAGTYLGLFRKIKDATVCNLRIENSYFNTNKATFIGSIAGGGDGTFDSVYSNAIVRGSRYVGGLIGRVSDTTTNADTTMILKSCHFDGVVDLDYTGTSTLYSGGLVGFTVHGSTIIDTCLYTGRILLDYNCNGSKTSWDAYVGALCGGDNDTNGYVQVKNCISAGSVNATVLSASTSPEVTVKCMNQTIGSARHANSWAKNTYVIKNNTRTIESTGVTTKSDETFARAKNSLEANFDVDSSFEKETLYGYGAQMWTDLAFTSEDRLAADNAALEEGKEPITVAGPIWAAVAGELPVPATLAKDALEMTVGKPDTTLAGSGTQADPWKITSVEELAGFALNSKSDNYAGEYVVLTKDIIINEGEDAKKWVDDKAEPTLPWCLAIGSSTGKNGEYFEGIFDGQGHTISGICFENGAKNAREFVSLFATTEVGSVVKNLRIRNSYFEQVGTGWVGSVVGKCRGTVSNVYSDAIIKSSYENVGGIIAMADGYNYKNASASTESRISRTVDNCWYAGEIILVDEGRYSGGIAGLINQGEWTFNNCIFTGKITCGYTGTSYAYVGGMAGALEVQKSIATSSKETKLTLNSCISAGYIQTENGDYGAGAFVGRTKANVWFTDDEKTTLKEYKATHVVMNNVFATRDSGYQEVGHCAVVKASDSAGNPYSATPTTTGHAVWTNNADRLVGYCTEEVKDDYVGGSLDFTNTFVMREEGVPVPRNFTDLEFVTPFTEVDTILALTSMDSSWTTKNAVNYGLGHYVLRTTGKNYDNYVAYLAALEEQGFTPYTTLEETGTDGVYNVIYTKTEGEWVLNILFVQNTGEVTLTISNGFDSLSSDLETEESTTSGTVTLSMLQLEGSKTAFTSIQHYIGYEDYYYGNSFVFKLPNGHFVINDGGKAADMEGLMKYLRNEAGYATDDATSKIYIDAWTVTHQHADHFHIMRNIVDNPQYAEQLVVNAIYLNEPNQKAMLSETGKDAMDTIDVQYRGIRMLKDANGNRTKVYWCQTGQTYYFDGLTMNILQSQEQIPVESYGKRNAGSAPGTDFNTSSTNMLFTTANGKKVLITGDSNYVNMEWMMNAYGSSSEMFDNIHVYQVPHHGKNTSYNIDGSDRSIINVFTDYVAGDGEIEVSLLPCSVFYEYNAKHEKSSGVFPMAEIANKHLIDNVSIEKFNYGKGTIKVTLGDEISASVDTSVDTGTDTPEIEEGEAD